MKKYVLGLLLLLILVGIVFYRSQNSSEQPQQVKRQPQVVRNQAPIIDWSKASEDAQTYQIRFEQVEAAVKTGAKCYDVRSFIEYQLGHISIAEHYPVSQLRERRFPDLIQDMPIYLYGSDSVSSSQAAQLLREAGFRHVYDLGTVEQVKAIGGQFTEWWS